MARLLFDFTEISFVEPSAHDRSSQDGIVRLGFCSGTEVKSCGGLIFEPEPVLAAARACFLREHSRLGETGEELPQVVRKDQRALPAFAGL